MASMIVERLRNEALKLPHTERAELACRLVQSLADPAGPADPATAGTHATETLRRLAEAASENTQVIDRAEFARYLRERMEQP